MISQPRMGMAQQVRLITAGYAVTCYRPRDSTPLPAERSISSAFLTVTYGLCCSSIVLPAPLEAHCRGDVQRHDPAVPAIFSEPPHERLDSAFARPAPPQRPFAL